MLGSCVRDREARADGQARELIDRVAAGAPVRQLLVVEALGHARLPFAGYRPYHRAGIELAAIDAHRAAEAAADLERGFNDRITRQARRHRFEIGDFAGRGAAGHSVPPRSVRWVRKILTSNWDQTVLAACVLPGEIGSAAYTLDKENTFSIVAGGNFSQTAKTTTTTPFFQTKGTPLFQN